MTKKQKLFELIHALNISESAEYPDTHIIRTTGYIADYILTDPEEIADEEYRVYHSSGLCFDVARTKAYDEFGVFQGDFEYVYFNEWDGFERVNVARAIQLIENIKIK